ncbi:hypothetical protein P154DRAFT_212843 [Amniculicola lignicola CBS 123094]|uniref:Uncharacterized protein n=1 Tax=Amniculicola lignicola CBS 123094 TaxID=1392246 RepID=A0A6A5WQ61_9PLEO|nr:hypothetical protein P154DRAFT_212843 [Amniculicola lignicola CBS 123094]
MVWFLHFRKRFFSIVSATLTFDMFLHHVLLGTVLDLETRNDIWFHSDIPDLVFLMVSLLPSIEILSLRFANTWSSNRGLVDFRRISRCLVLEKLTTLYVYNVEFMVDAMCASPNKHKSTWHDISFLSCILSRTDSWHTMITALPHLSCILFEEQRAKLTRHYKYNVRMVRQRDGISVIHNLTGLITKPRQPR